MLMRGQSVFDEVPEPDALDIFEGDVFLDSF